MSIKVETWEWQFRPMTHFKTGAIILDPQAATVERANPQAATTFLSHAGENVSRKSRKLTQLKAFSFIDYQLITKLISIMDNI